MLFPTTIVGSYPQPDWLIDREAQRSGRIYSGIDNIHLQDQAVQRAMKQALFESGMVEYDGALVFMDIDDARTLFERYRDTLSSVGVTFQDGTPFDAA